MASSLPNTPIQDGSSGGKWVRKMVGRLGVAGFLLFLAKGLLWLIVPSLLVMVGIQC